MSEDTGAAKYTVSWSIGGRSAGLAGMGGLVEWSSGGIAGNLKVTVGSIQPAPWNQPVERLHVGGSCSGSGLGTVPDASAWLWSRPGCSSPSSSIFNLIPVASTLSVRREAEHGRNVKREASLSEGVIRLT